MMVNFVAFLNFLSFNIHIHTRPLTFWGKNELREMEGVRGISPAVFFLPKSEIGTFRNW